MIQETAQGYDDRGSSWAPGEELLQGINKDAAELVGVHSGCCGDRSW